jgi:hypothetical protein
MFCCGYQSLQAAIATVLGHADEDLIKQTVLLLLRSYAASTATSVDDALVDVVERCLFPRQAA